MLEEVDSYYDFTEKNGARINYWELCHRVTGIQAVFDDRNTFEGKICL